MSYYSNYSPYTEMSSYADYEGFGYDPYMEGFDNDWTKATAEEKKGIVYKTRNMISERPLVWVAGATVGTAIISGIVYNAMRKNKAKKAGGTTK